MTREDDFIGQLRNYLDEYEGLTPLPDTARDAVRAELPSTKQIGPLPGPMRSLSMSIQIPTAVRYGLAAAVTVAAVLLGANLIGRNGTGQETPSPSDAASPTPAATPSEKRVESLDGAAGTYYVDAPFPARISFEVPSGWYHWGNAADVNGLLVEGPANGSGWGIAFSLMADVYLDPCDRNVGVTDLPVGVSVDELVEALSDLPGVEASPPMEITIDGFDGKLIELTATYDRADCPTVNAGLWTSPGGGEIGLSVGGVNRVNQVRILDIGGTPLAIWTSDFPETTEFEEGQGLQLDPEEHSDDQVELQEILDSIRIQPD